MLSKTKKFLSKSGTIIEIPPLRLPTVRGIAGTIKEKAEDFVLKAGSIVFIVSVCVWFLQSFGLNGYTENVKDSFLFYIIECGGLVFLLSLMMVKVSLK